MLTAVAKPHREAKQHGLAPPRSNMARRMCPSCKPVIYLSSQKRWRTTPFPKWGCKKPDRKINMDLLRAIFSGVKPQISGWPMLTHWWKKQHNHLRQSGFGSKNILKCFWIPRLVVLCKIGLPTVFERRLHQWVESMLHFPSSHVPVANKWIASVSVQLSSKELENIRARDPKQCVCVRSRVVFLWIGWVSVLSGTIQVHSLFTWISQWSVRVRVRKWVWVSEEWEKERGECECEYELWVWVSVNVSVSECESECEWEWEWACVSESESERVRVRERVWEWVRVCVS